MNKHLYWSLNWALCDIDFITDLWWAVPDNYLKNVPQGIKSVLIKLKNIYVISFIVQSLFCIENTILLFFILRYWNIMAEKKMTITMVMLRKYYVAVVLWIT